ncbi:MULTISPECIES: DUF2188 domain-containing protein [unclassified Bosea (in: a-proteobacteria)]|uniref:DUF2188 domain-containing protein n=1 Tax=unclassified Bosea (in: a-proteobacteria) TaxID=2653178 RepID=UPI000954B551|nr:MULTISPECIES: DUF2188 domain-containing protein [unclassified Bosea (in: a-proteobacteria)]TAJ27909.1 MAG: DUF2188 domain-containing protein [Bosea sp. (in: a-proteobacteria)]SIR30784.1 hypothetical protein SAMN05880592_11539 [Bosea sp. TND4EK4]
MSKVRYEVVEHDGGWAYKVGDVLSETYPSHEVALKAATDAAARQTVAGSTDGIVYQDNQGQWHEELADGHDRPSTEVVDKP